MAARVPRKEPTAAALLLMAGAGNEITELLRSSGDMAISGNAQIWVLVFLRTKGPSRPVQLAKSFGMSTGGMTKVLDQLEEAGLVIRTADDVKDGRHRLTHLTDQGLAHIDRILTVIAPPIDQLMNDMAALATEPSTTGDPAR